MKKNLLRHTGRVSIELSNRCDMAPFHVKCPLHEEMTPVFLPVKTVTDIIGWLGKNSYDKFIAFHNYNEPLQDPRLYYLLKYTKKKCRNASVIILTNGHWLNQTILTEISILGVKKIYASAYSQSDYKRLSRLKCDRLKYKVRRITNLDERLSGYCTDSAPLTKPCYAPFGEVVIRCSGDVVLCCRDWNNRHIFGNVINTRLSKILSKKSMSDAYRMLSNGRRFYELCRGCTMEGRYKEK